jgi:BirA family transcriptional regulator, biotin operon repressor / biotin---[acetyl-CoA-carboxylase] ligase
MNTTETLFTGINSIYLPEVDSTNLFAMNLLAKTNPPEGTCVHTAYQSAGRGQIGRFWYSSEGENLLISYILYPKPIKAIEQFILNIISGLAVRDVVRMYCDNVKIKWPNDIYVDDKKIAGILVQNVLRGPDIKATVMGIGLNVNEQHFPSVIPNPVSIGQITSKSHDLTEIRQLLSSKLEFYYMKMKYGHHEWLKENYINTMYRINETANFKTDGETIISGKIRGINEQGKLLIQAENEDVLAFGFREIGYVI